MKRAIVLGAGGQALTRHPSWSASGWRPSHHVLRVSSLFDGTRAKSSIDRLADALAAGHPVQAFSDRTVSPGYVDDVAAGAIALSAGSPEPGLYHCVNTGPHTWLGVARELASLLERPDDLVVPIEMAGLSMRVPRPFNGALSNTKLTAAGVAMPTWQNALERYVRSRSSRRPMSVD